jgi:hypothetical protein
MLLGLFNRADAQRILAEAARGVAEENLKIATTTTDHLQFVLFNDLDQGYGQ